MRWIGHHVHAEADLDIEGQTTLVQAYGPRTTTRPDSSSRVPKLRSAAIHALPAHRTDVATHWTAARTG